VELAIVILIMGLLLGGLAMPLSTQLENGRIRETRAQIDEVKSAIEGFAIANGHLPCPALPGSNGESAPAAGGCQRQHGFVPATTLGLAGLRNADNLLLDSWASPLRYSVTASDADANGNWDFVTPGELRSVTMPLLQPDLTVCSIAAGTTPVACASPASTLTSTAPLLVFSMGKDWASFTSADQLENAGATVSGGPSGLSYPVADDPVYVSRRQSDASGSEFDDLLDWTAPGRLYERLLSAGQLP